MLSIYEETHENVVLCDVCHAGQAWVDHADADATCDRCGTMEPEVDYIGRTGVGVPILAAAACVGRKRLVVICPWDNGQTKYVVWWMGPDRVAYSGRYVTTYANALAILADRASHA